MEKKRHTAATATNNTSGLHNRNKKTARRQDVERAARYDEDGNQGCPRERLCDAPNTKSAGQNFILVQCSLQIASPSSPLFNLHTGASRAVSSTTILS
jgi:hypothetical protein